MYKVLIIGAGNIASEYDHPTSNFFLTHAHAFVEHSGFLLIGFVDPDPLKIANASRKWKTKGFADLKDAFEYCPDVDIVCMTVPDHLHFDMLRKICYFQPKLVFTEKPLTDTLEQAIIIEDLYNKHNIPILINFKRAFVPEILELIKRVKKDEFGQFVSCYGLYNRGFKHNGSHLIDLIIRVTGCSELKLLNVIDSLADFSVDDLSYSFVASTEKHASVIIKSFDGNSYPIFELDLHFTLGRIRIFNTGEKIEVHKIQSSSAFSGFEFLQPMYCIDTSIHQSMIYAVNNIFEYLSGGTSLAVPISDGIQVMKLTDQILEDIKNKQCQN